MHLTTEASKWPPKDVNKDKETQVWINLYEKRLINEERKSKLNVGDFIRLSIKNALFVKRYQEIWPYTFY